MSHSLWKNLLLSPVVLATLMLVAVNNIDAAKGETNQQLIAENKTMVKFGVTVWESPYQIWVKKAMF